MSESELMIPGNGSRAGQSGHIQAMLFGPVEVITANGCDLRDYAPHVHDLDWKTPVIS